MKFLNDVDGAKRIKQDSQNRFVTEQQLNKLNEINLDDYINKWADETHNFNLEILGETSLNVYSEASSENMTGIPGFIPLVGGTMIETLEESKSYSVMVLDSRDERALSGTLILHTTDTLYSQTFPSEIKWLNNEIPDISKPNTTYILNFISVDKGQTVYGNWGEY